jgi:ketosteroid isomerase-like protein
VRASGNSFELRIVHVWTIGNGKITRFEAYIDTPVMLKALRGESTGFSTPESIA